MSAGFILVVLISRFENEINSTPTHTVYTHIYTVYISIKIICSRFRNIHRILLDFKLFNFDLSLIFLELLKWLNFVNISCISELSKSSLLLSEQVICFYWCVSHREARGFLKLFFLEVIFFILTTDHIFTKWNNSLTIVSLFHS